jgi:FkbM family methyltransferase
LLSGAVSRLSDLTARRMRLPLKVEIELRAAGRRLGLTRAYLKTRSALRREQGYEEKFNSALRVCVRPGDVVWDVGANVGLYTVQFSEWVGSGGSVLAFEPVPATFQRLTHATKGRVNVSLFPFALGTTTGTAQIYAAEDPNSGTHSLTPLQAGRTAIEIRVEAGDLVVDQQGVRTPNVLNIDVEGSEFDVLSGLTKTLRRPTCRAVACEVHFAVLAARGEKHKPREIEMFLQDHGFRTRWTDASHVLATRD